MWKKSIFILIIFVFYSCQKQNQPVNEGEQADIISIANDEDLSQEYIVDHGSSLIINNKNFPLKDIIGTWWMGAPFYTLEIEFTNDSILYIKEYDNDYRLSDENFYPYKIEKNNILIENVDKSNNFDKYISDFFFTPGVDGVYIEELDAKKLMFIKTLRIGSDNTEVRNSAPFYRGNIEELLESRNIRLDYEDKLKEFIYEEALNGIIFQGDTNDENGVINTYGVPLKDEITEYSDGKRYEGGMSLVGIREIIYEDLTHRYYIFINRSNIERQFYVDVSINKKLGRLVMLNIGATSEEVMAVFGSNYWRKDEEDIIYMWDGSEGYRWVRFSIENNIVINISYIITSWG
jgi:hypothetical protein